MTRALDTNVVVRALADPASAQHATALSCLSEAFSISISVLMETEWVLRSVYRWSREQIGVAFHDLIDLPSHIASPREAAWVLARFAEGADFADMVHLVMASGATRYATFDRGMPTAAGTTTPIPIEILT